MRPLPLERRVLDALPITVYAVDLDGRVTFVNREGARGDESSIVGAPIWDIIGDPAVRVPMEQAMAALREGRTAPSWELPLHTPTDERVLLVQVGPLLEREAVTGYTVATVDLTASHRAREQKQRVTAVADVSTGVAHELRNPLFGISSAAQLLRFRVKDDPIVEKNVGRILREVDRLNAVVTGLLDYGRPDPLHRTPGDPDALWDEVLETQRGRLESRALLLHRIRAEPPAHCAIDAGQLAQVLLNLLVNATDAAPPGTDLTLHSSVLPDGAWRCRLHNGGAEIPADMLPRVFDLFLTTKPGGTGIGLALCRRIVEQHDGTITLESAPEHGTTATLVLPGIPGRRPPDVSASAHLATSPLPGSARAML
jgi:two-component system, NtrC family, sensor histidine kinase AtoS